MDSPSEAERLARRIVARLRESGHSAFLVGGCVRDRLLGMRAKDFDVATSARPAEVLRLFPGSGEVGAHFGVVLVDGDGAVVEVATYRRDLGYVDGRRPVGVEFESSPREDALRRDFTINALFLDPESDEVIDFTGGREDLERGVIRAIGEPARRFAEDRLRMLRAVRFASRLGFEIETSTMEAIRTLAREIEAVSAERVRDELNRILTEGHPRRGMELLDRSGLLGQVLPEVARMKGVEQPPEFHPEGDVWVHTLMMLDGLEQPTVTLAWGVLLHDVGKPPTFRAADRIRFDGHVEQGVAIARAILTRLRFPAHAIEAVEALVANHMKFMEVTRMRESKLKRFIRMPDFEEHLALHRLDCLSSHGHLGNYEFVRRKLAEMPPEALKPAPLITGRDLIAAGFRPGPKFREALEAVEDAQLEGRMGSRDEAMALARGLL